MSDQLAFDVGLRPVKVETSSSTAFVVAQFAAVAGLRHDEATAYLEEFAAAGVVEKLPGGFRLTPWGRRVACDLALCDGRDVHDNHNPREERHGD